MQNYVITTCSTADVTPEYLKTRCIDYLAFSFCLDGKEYKDDMGATMPHSQFYEAMKNGATTSTSQPNVDELKDFLDHTLKTARM